MKMNYIYEEWKPIKGYEGLYEVSNFGRVKSLPRIENSGNLIRKRNGKIIKQIVDKRKNNRCRVTLYKNGVSKRFQVHQLVAFAFPEICGEYFEGAEVNHKGENPSKNYAWQLEWCTHQYNNTFGSRINRMVDTRINGNYTKTILQYDINGNFIKEWRCVLDICKELGFKNNSNIYSCCTGKPHFKTAYGFKWKFKE